MSSSFFSGPPRSIRSVSSAPAPAWNSARTPALSQYVTSTMSTTTGWPSPAACRNTSLNRSTLPRSMSPVAITVTRPSPSCLKN
jgi:hypothetical protein